MARIEIPSQNTPPVSQLELWSQPEPEDSEFTPVLLTQLQDDLARSRLREAFWISIIAHLVAIIFLALSPKLLPSLLPVRLRSAEEMINGKEMTMLELPPDAQRPPAKPPNTRILSDKNRIATSKLPTPDRKTLESIRKGLPQPPGPLTPQAPSNPPSQSFAQGGMSAPAPSSQSTGNAQPTTNNSASLRVPQPQRSLTAMAGSLSAGSTIQQAARNSARGGFSGGGGGGGDYGVPGGGGSKVHGEMDILSDTMGVDFAPYLSRLHSVVLMHWLNLVPEAARPPMLKKGKVAIEFMIMPDGKVAGMRLVGESGDISLDRAAWGGIMASNPLPPLPSEFHGPYLALRAYFYYNPDRRDLE